jgi:hypothetical protein
MATFDWPGHTAVMCCSPKLLFSLGVQAADEHTVQQMVTKRAPLCNCKIAAIYLLLAEWCSSLHRLAWQQ